MANILIVDDEKDLADTIGDFLEFEGHKVKPVTDGYKAIEEVKAVHYDLVLMDIRLPDINGVEAFLKIKEIDPEIRVIMMTGFAVEDLVDEAIRQGAYACVPKPFDMERLLRLIEEALKQKKRVILIADDIDEIRREIGSFLKSKSFTICEAKSGKEVISKVKERHYDIILLDYGLPDMDGLIVFRKAKDIDPDIVAILMLDRPLEVVVKDALKEGFYDWITKPIDPERLLEIVEVALKN